MKYNPFTAVLFGLRPPGVQIEARYCCDRQYTEYRFIRLSDGLWCQQMVSDDLVYQVFSVTDLAEHILDVVARNFAESAA